MENLGKLIRDQAISGFNEVTRVEVIDDSGRWYVKNKCVEVELQLQDGGRTLKIFVTNLPKDIDNEHS